MKSIKIHAIWAFLLALTLTGCSNDEKTEGETPGEDVFDMYGLYLGELSFQIEGGQKLILDKQFLFVEQRPEPKTLRLAIKDFTIDEEEYGNIMTPATYEKENKTEYSLEGYSGVITIPDVGKIILNTLGLIKDKDITLNVEGTIEDVAGKKKKITATYVGQKTDIKLKNYQFNFEKWEIQNPLEAETNHFSLPEVVEGIAWCSTDREVVRYKGTGRMDQFTVGSKSESVEGKLSAQVQTVETLRGSNELMIPKIYSGYFYIGSFVDKQAHPHEGIKLGVPFEEEPISIKGYYFYRPGEVYYECPDITKPTEVVVNEEKVDACSISAYLYEVSSFDAENEILSLRNITQSDKVVASASFTSSKKTRSFEEFEIKLRWKDGKQFDKDRFYRLTVLVTASKDGYRYSGAPHSSLLVDNIKIATKQAH